MKIKAYIDQESKLIVNNKESKIKLTKEVYEKLSLQTSSTFLIEKDGDLVFDNSLDKVLKELRKKRDEKISETDYLFLSDTTKLTDTATKAALKIERQRLRDITNNVNTIEEALKLIKTI